MPPKEIRDLKSLEKQLVPGDILVASAKVPTSGGVVSRAASEAFAAASRAVQGSDKTHSMLYMGNGEVVETRHDTGIRKIKLRDALQRLDAQVVRPVVSAEERKKALRRVKAFYAQGTRYDLPGVFRAALEHFGVPTAEKAPEAVTCSTLISHAYQSKLVPEKPRSAVLPADLLRSERVKEILHFKNPGRRGTE